MFHPALIPAAFLFLVLVAMSPVIATFWAVALVVFVVLMYASFKLERGCSINTMAALISVSSCLYGWLVSYSVFH